MHRSRINGIQIDCNTDDIDAAARFWAQALGRPVLLDHPGTRDNYRMLETPPGECDVQIQRVDHESRVHLDIETDDIPAEVARLEKLGAMFRGFMESLDAPVPAGKPPHSRGEVLIAVRMAGPIAPIPMTPLPEEEAE